MRAFNPKIIAGIFTAMILALLVVAGPAEAFILDMSLSDDKPAAGESVTFDVSTEVESADAPADVSFFTLFIKHENKKDVISCSFTPDGEILSDCPGITIVKKSSAPEFGYGYSGFGAGKFAFDIILDTTGIKHGAYRTFFVANVAGEEFEKEGKKLIISERKEKEDDDEDEDEQEREDDEDDEEEENEHQDKEEKVKVCHVPLGNPSNAHTIEIGSPALQAHLAHGDSEGECPKPEEQPNNEGSHHEDNNNDHDDDDNEDHHENNEQHNDNRDKQQKNDNSNNGKGKGKNK